MADKTVTSAMAEVRAYLGDSHPADRGAVPASDLLSFLQTEYDQVWNRCQREGVTASTDAATSTTALSWVDDVPGPVALPTNVLAVSNVFQYDGTAGGSYRYLKAAQPGDGKLPFGQERGPATHFAVYGMGSDATVQLWPYPGLPSAGNAYFVQYLPTTKTLVTGTPAAGQTSSIVGLPSSGVDRVILGAARRAYMARRESSPQLNDLIRAADMDISMDIASRISGEGMRFRNTDHRTRGWYRRGQDVAPLTTVAAPRSAWIWLY